MEKKEIYRDVQFFHGALQLFNSMGKWCLLQKNRIRDAAYRYQYALKKLPVGGVDIYAELQVNLMLNLSRCKRKLNVSLSSMLNLCFLLHAKLYEILMCYC